jgi:hypothetical protein
MTPAMVEQYKDNLALYSSGNCFKMMASQDSDVTSQTFQAQYKFLVIHDKVTNTIKYKVRSLYLLLPH